MEFVDPPVLLDDLDSDYPYRVFCFDDNDGGDNEHLQQIMSWLRTHNYRVFGATNEKETRHCLENDYFHIAILDNRLQHSSDPDDYDKNFGYRLAKQYAHPRVRIIYSRFDYGDDMLDALRESQRNQQAEKKNNGIIDFFSKDEPVEDFLKHLKREIPPLLKLNRQLQLRFNTHYQDVQIVRQIIPDLPVSNIDIYVEEFQDIFRHQFHDSVWQHLVLEPLYLTASSLVWLKVTGFKANDTIESFLIACGKPAAIQVAFDQYKQYIESDKLDKSDTPIAPQKISTLHFGLFTLPLGAVDTGPVISAQQLFKEEGPRTLQNLIQPVYEYDSAMPLVEVKPQQIPLYEAVQETEQLPDFDMLQININRLCQQYTRMVSFEGQINSDSQTLQFQHMDGGLYPNPQAFAKEILTQPVRRKLNQAQGMMYLDGFAIERHKGLVYLIDHSKTRPRLSTLYDYVTMEWSIRTVLAPEFLPVNQIKFDQAIFGSSHEKLSTPFLRQAVSLIQALHSRALEDTACDITAYQQDLFAYLIYYLAQPVQPGVWSPREVKQHLHMLLLAAELAAILHPDARAIQQIPEQATDFWIDETRQRIWINGDMLEPTPQEFRILAYLFAHQGEVCKIRDIWLAVDDLLQKKTYKVNHYEKRRLQTAISRLRHRLREYPHIQITSKRGVGYILTSDEIQVQ